MAKAGKARQKKIIENIIKADYSEQAVKGIACLRHFALPVIEKGRL